MTTVEILQLEDVAEFVRGVTFRPEDVVEGDPPNTVWCMRTKNVQTTLDISDVWSISPVHVKRNNQYLNKGDILVSSANSWNLIGKCSWVPNLNQPSTFGGFVSTLRANRKYITPRYLYHWFSNPKTQFTIRSFGRQTTNISNLDIKRCLKMPVPVPEIETQKRITDLLDTVESARSKRRKSIELLDELTQSIFLDMFGDPVTNTQGWKELPLTKACRTYSGGTPKKSLDWGEGVPWFSPKDIKKNDLIDSQDHVSQETAEAAKLKILPENTVVIVVRGMILRHSFPVSTLRTKATINQDLKALIPQEGIEPDFLAGCLRAQKSHALNQVSMAAHGTTRLDTRGLQEIPVVIPPVENQREYTRRISDINKLRAKHQAHLAHLDELFASVQQRAFDGTLWDDPTVTS